MNDSTDSVPANPVTPKSRYVFRIRGRLDQEMASWFDDMTLTVNEATAPTQTLIQGVIRDQAALYGCLNRIRDLGLVLLSVNVVNEKEDS